MIYSISSDMEWIMQVKMSLRHDATAKWYQYPLFLELCS